MSRMTRRPKLSSMAEQKTVDRFILIRRQAISAFSVLKENIYFMCKCAEISHGISLQLQWQYISSPTKLSSDFALMSTKQQHILTILISKEGNVKPWSWRQIQLEPLMLPEPLDPDKAISTSKRIVRFQDSTPQAEDLDSLSTTPIHNAIPIAKSKLLPIPSLTLTPSFESLTLSEVPTRMPTPTCTSSDSIDQLLPQLSIEESTMATLSYNQRQEGIRGANTTETGQSFDNSGRQPLQDFKRLGWLD